jgi:hypothetical protein
MRLRSHRGRLAAMTSAAVIGLSLVGALPADAGGGHNGGGSGSPPGTKTTIATGLDNPRQLSFAPWGDLLVAEAGKGGDGPCRPSPEGGGAQECFGASGAVTKIDSRGQQSRIITGLPSFGGEGTGTSAIGPSDVLAVGRNISILIGLGTNPANRDGIPAPGQQMGTLIQTTKNYSSFRTIADLAAFEAKKNPIDDPDSDPVGMLYDDGDYVVADAGGNTVLNVNQHRNIRLLAKFEDLKVDAPSALGLPSGTQIPMQAVPTSVAAKDHDGSYYISQLTGFPFPKGAANIFKIDRNGKVTSYASGLTNVTDLAFDGRDLYAVQISTEGLLNDQTDPNGPTGSVVKVKPGGSVPADHTTIAGRLTAPYGIAIKNNNAYVTIGAVAPGGGQVLKIQL